MVKDIYGGKIKASWRGTACSLLCGHSNERETELLKSKYIEYRGLCPTDAKGREHYYVKSFILPFIIAQCGIDSVFHIGFASERYLWSYRYFGIKNIMGCDVNKENNDGWMTVQEIEKCKSEYTLIKDRDFLKLDDKDYSDVKALSKKACLISEATFYWITNHKFGCWGNSYRNYANLDESTVRDLQLRIQRQILRFRDIGFENFIFIEEDVPMFSEIPMGIKYEKITMGENFKHDYLLNYSNFVFPVAHVYSDNDSLREQIRLLER